MVGFIRALLACTLAVVVANGNINIVDERFREMSVDEIPPPIRFRSNIDLERAFTFNGRKRDKSRLLKIQPAESRLKDFYIQNPSPLRNRRCTKTFRYKPDAVFNEKTFMCDKSVNVPYTFPEHLDDRMPWAVLSNNVIGIAANATGNSQRLAFNYYMDLYNLMDRGTPDMPDFKQCVSKEKRFVPTVKDNGYRLEPVCKTVVVDYSNRPVAHRLGNKIYPCFIPHPVELKGVECQHPEKRRSNRCRLGYATYPNYVCVPTDFVRRKVPLFCPDYGIATTVIRLPQACSCKMCYNCGKSFDYDAYEEKAIFKDLVQGYESLIPADF